MPSVFITRALLFYANTLSTHKLTFFSKAAPSTKNTFPLKFNGKESSFYKRQIQNRN